MSPAGATDPATTPDTPAVDVRRPERPTITHPAFPGGNLYPNMPPMPLSEWAASMRIEQTSCEKGHQRITFTGTKDCPLCASIAREFTAHHRTFEVLGKLEDMTARAHRAELEATRLKSTAPLPAESVVFKGVTDGEREVIRCARNFIRRPDHFRLAALSAAVQVIDPGYESGELV